jgi:DNA-directed RNA polymerase specialized sigma subunit
MQRSKWIEQKRQRRQEIYEYYLDHSFTETAEHFGITGSRVAMIVSRIKREEGWN